MKLTSTDGTPDSEKTFPQTISSDSEVLSAINEDEETPFKVSLEMKAAGVAENNVYARESGYSNAIENSAIIGVAPEFVYTDGLAVEEVTVKFEIDNSIVGNTLGTYAENNDGFRGIKRLMVFMFFEDVNMLLPVETEYDETNNVVSATTDRVGTYCLIDMELFFQNLGIEPDNSINSVDKIELMAYNGNNDTADSVYKDNFDVVFMIDEISYTDDQLKEIKKEIQAVSEIIFNHSKDVTISIYGLNGNGSTHSTWYGRADNIDNVEIMLSHVSHKEIGNENNHVALSECIDYVIAAHKINASFAKREEYGFVYYDPYYLNSNDELVFRFLADSSRTGEYGLKMLELVENEGTDIDFSTVTASYSEILGKNTSYAKYLSEKTNGEFINGTSYTSVVNESIEHIYGKVLEDVNVYKILIATNFEYVNLKKPITEKYIENSIKYGHNYIADISEFDEEDIADCADTDEDGLWDFQEIKIFKGLIESSENQIIRFENGELILPTVNEMTKEVFKDFYSSEEINAFREHFAEQYGHNIDSEFWNLPVLPINSHPEKYDTDGDGIFDKYDYRPLKRESLPNAFIENINNGVMHHKLIKSYNHELLFVYEGKLSNDVIYSITGNTISSEINTRYLLYAFKYDNDEFVYKISDYRLSEKELENKYSNIYSVLYMKYCIDCIKNDMFQDYGTISIGLVGSVSPTAVDFAGEYALSFDKRGNISLQATFTDGFTTGGGASFGAQISYTNAPDVRYLNGFSTSVGVSAAVGDVGGGCDIIIFEDSDGNTYVGSSLAYLVGAELEGHVNFNETYTIFNWNIFDEFDERCNKLLQLLTE